MASIGAVLKDEISRLARREIKRQTTAIKRASSAHRKHIAALKRQVQDLERQLRASLRQRAAAPAKPADAEPGTAHRFVAKGLKTLRSRLGLSAEAFGQLVGVSGQSVYNWEARKAVPRAKQVAAIAQLRGLGKTEAAARLAQLRSKAKPAPAKRGRKRSAKRVAKRKAR